MSCGVSGMKAGTIHRSRCRTVASSCRQIYYIYSNSFVQFVVDFLYRIVRFVMWTYSGFIVGHIVHNKDHDMSRICGFVVQLAC